MRGTSHGDVLVSPVKSWVGAALAMYSLSAGSVSIREALDYLYFLIRPGLSWIVLDGPDVVECSWSAVVCIHRR